MRIHPFAVGESRFGTDYEAAHINIMIGPKVGPAGHAFAHALAARNGALIATVAPNLPAKPDTVVFSRITLKGVEQATHLFGPIQAAVARAVVHSAEEGIIPKGEIESTCVLVAVFIHWNARDAAKASDVTYQATKHAIAQALAGGPSLDELILAMAGDEHFLDG
jgi:5,6,7,8-tetrahydromethanopterin hydro-lyase